MIAAILLAGAVGYAHPEQLVDTDWVAAHATDANVRVVDVRRSGFDAGHIPGAVWLDPEAIRDPGNAPSFMLAETAFEQAVGRLGISNRTRIILYDDRGGLLAARVWWILNAYGHGDVALVDGGWVRWTAEKRPSSTAMPMVTVARFKSADDLRALFEARGITTAGEVIAYCWVGHRSAVDLFALHLIGHDRLRNYLGSWEEWSRRPDLPTAPFPR